MDTEKQSVEQNKREALSRLKMEHGPEIKLTATEEWLLNELAITQHVITLAVGKIIEGVGKLTEEIDEVTEKLNEIRESLEEEGAPQ